MFNIWPYFLRLAVSLYFIYPHGLAMLQGVEKARLAVFACVDEYIPSTVAFTLWHSFFVLLGFLIFIWPRPVLPLLVALVIFTSQLYINFALHSYTTSNMLLFILVLVTLALLIYHARPQFR
jgi:hypothetical protein